MNNIKKNFINPMEKDKILFICGTMNTTTMLHQIAKELENEYDCYFTHMYADGLIGYLGKKDLLNFVPLSGKVKYNTIEYFKKNNLKIDFFGSTNDYSLVVTCTDLIIPNNIKNTKIVHVQEGMTDPEDFRYLLAKYMKAPRYIASTSVMGLSDEYDYFCVASDGYKDLFIRKGVKPEKIVVTGLPNFDNFAKYKDNNFPYKNFALVATSDTRETFKYENRKAFIEKAKKLSKGKQLIFKLHPNENHKRAIKEINKYAPGALVYTDANIWEMIANCDILITKYSTVVYAGLALGKEVCSDIDINELKKLIPNQNNGQSAKNIAEVCRKVIKENIILQRDNLLKFEPLNFFKVALDQYSKYLNNKVAL